MSPITIASYVLVVTAAAYLVAGQVYAYRMALTQRRTGGLTLRQHLWFSAVPTVSLSLSVAMLVMSFAAPIWIWAIICPVLFFASLTALVARDWRREDAERWS